MCETDRIFYLFFLHIWNQTEKKILPGDPWQKDFQKSPGRKHECFESHWCTSALCGLKECHQNRHRKIIIPETAKALFHSVTHHQKETHTQTFFPLCFRWGEKEKSSWEKKTQQKQNKHFSLHVFTEKIIKELFFPPVLKSYTQQMKLFRSHL